MAVMAPITLYCTNDGIYSCEIRCRAAATFFFRTQGTYTHKLSTFKMVLSYACYPDTRLRVMLEAII